MKENDASDEDDNDDYEDWEEFEWCNINEINEGNQYTVFEEGATVDDIIQGEINDCYFLSTLGSLCSYDDFFEKLFYIKDISENHFYGIYSL